ncbi:hypothetical protein PRZ48_009804 [Zasmidium cellare]|uniref:F-box domain-containing protein n=1 Tax=Zasmidium cellare TaxID=395010 RepID=A0ABR0ECR6_ZASCE|nr:hypothetical protein PRZ48_009804 [Zasmidium cellare]
MADDAAENSDFCPLLDLLPGELRNNIYEYALSDANLTVSTRSGDNATVSNILDAAALTMTCKQIHQECGNLLYELNTATFSPKLPEPEDCNWLTRVAAQQQQRNILKRIIFELPELSEGVPELSRLRALNIPLQSLERSGANTTLRITMRPSLDLRFRVTDDEESMWAAIAACDRPENAGPGQFEGDADLVAFTYMDCIAAAAAKKDTWKHKEVELRGTLSMFHTTDSRATKTQVQASNSKSPDRITRCPAPDVLVADALVSVADKDADSGIVVVAVAEAVDNGIDVVEAATPLEEAGEADVVVAVPVSITDP